MVRWNLCRQFLSLTSRDQILTNNNVRFPTCACYFGSQKILNTHAQAFFSSTYTYRATTTAIITTAITPPWSRPKLLIAIWTPPTLPVVPNTSANCWRISWPINPIFLQKSTQGDACCPGSNWQPLCLI